MRHLPPYCLKAQCARKGAQILLAGLRILGARVRFEPRFDLPSPGRLREIYRVHGSWFRPLRSKE